MARHVCWKSIRDFFSNISLNVPGVLLFFPRRPLSRDCPASPWTRCSQDGHTALSSWVHLPLPPCWIPSWTFLSLFTTTSSLLTISNESLVGLCLLETKRPLEFLVYSLTGFVLCCVLLLPSLAPAWHRFGSWQHLEGRLAVLVSRVDMPASVNMKISPIFHSSSSCGFCFEQTRILSGLANAPGEGCLQILSSPVTISSFPGLCVPFGCPEAL